MADPINSSAIPELMQSEPTLGTDEDSDTNTITVRTAGTVVAQIENVLESVVDSLTEGQELSIRFSPRPRDGSQRRFEPVRYPGRTTQEARKFSEFKAGNECGANRTDSR